MAKKQSSAAEAEKKPEKEGASMRHLDKEYTQSYRQWRNDNKNAYGFFFRKSKNELTYQEGRGLIGDIPEYMEMNSLVNVNNVISQILFLYLLLTVLISNILPQFISEKFGLNIGIDFATRTFYGSDHTVMVYRYITMILSRLVPLVLLSAVAKMPFKIMFPMKISNKPLFNTAVPAALLTAAACSLMLIPTKNILTYMGASTDVDIINETGRKAVIFQIILRAVIVPIMSELIIHGAFMQLLRQFGDAYALIVTGIIIAVNAEDIRLMLFYFCCSMFVGYFTLRTGSVLTAIIMRFSMSIYSVIYTILYDMGRSGRIFSAAFMLLCIMTGLAFVIRFMIKNNHKISLPLNETYLSDYEKIMTFFTAPSVIIWLCSALAAMIVGIPLSL